MPGNKEKLSESNGKPKLEMDASDFAAMINEQLDLPLEGKESEVIKEPERREPDVEVEEPTKPSVSSQEVVGEGTRRPADPDLDRALKTIARLESEIAQLHSASREPEKPEPSIELEEILTGVRLPKDKSKWPIRVTPEDLIRLGWNDDPAKAINALANAFYSFVLDTIPATTYSMTEQANRNREAATKRKSTFFEQFSDLQGFDDLLEVVELRARSEGVAETHRGSDYINEIGKRARSRVASLRGMTLEQYEATLASKSSQGSPRSGRAVTTSTGARSVRSNLTEQQKEIEDLLKE